MNTDLSRREVAEVLKILEDLDRKLERNNWEYMDKDNRGDHIIDLARDIARLRKLLVDEDESSIG